jgi:hypothetical protein
MTLLPLLVLEAGSGTKILTISANPTLWTLFGSHKELGGASDIVSLCGPPEHGETLHPICSYHYIHKLF